VFNGNKHTYLLSPWCRVLLEKLTGLQLVKIFPAFHGTRKFITTLTSVRHLSLSWNNPIQSTYPHPTSWRSILILSTHLRLGLSSGLLPSGSLPRSYTPPLLTHTRHMPSPSHCNQHTNVTIKNYSYVNSNEELIPRQIMHPNIIQSKEKINQSQQH